jgi:digeranylgeranylglycerophospholipid reductase
MQEGKQFDVIIAGGGPAGLAAAKAATGAGLSVLLLEKSLEIGYPVHTSGGSWTRELEELGVPEKFIHPVPKIDFYSNNSSASFHYTHPEICVIDIRAVYQHLAKEASLLSAFIQTNTVVKEPLLNQGTLCGVKAVRNGEPVEYKAKLVIDATGFSGVLVRPLGLQKTPSGFGSGAEYEIITSSWQQDRIAILLGSAFTPVGYAWIFPCGENRVRVGFGVLRPHSQADPLKLLDGFLSSDREIANQLKPYSIIETHFGSVPNTGFIDKSYSDNLLAAGDSAGHVLGIAGEGIRLALDIGKMAGETAAQAVKQGDTSAAFLQSYEKAWKSKYRLGIELNARMNEIISKYTDSQWDRAISILQEVDPEVLLALMKGRFNLSLVRLILSRNPSLFAHNAFKIIKQAITGI